MYCFALTYHHYCRTEKKHEREICSAATKGAFFQHAAIAIREDHIEKEAESKRTKEAKRCDQTPKLKILKLKK